MKEIALIDWCRIIVIPVLKKSSKLQTAQPDINSLMFERMLRDSLEKYDSCESNLIMVYEEEQFYGKIIDIVYFNLHLTSSPINHKFINSDVSE